MSLASFPPDKLSQFDPRSHYFPELPFKTLHPIPPHQMPKITSMHTPLKREMAYCPSTFQQVFDDRVKIYPSYTDGLAGHDSAYPFFDASPSSFSNWMASSSMTADNSYDELSQSTQYLSEPYGEEPFDNTIFWPYEKTNSYTPSYPPFVDSILPSPSSSPSLSVGNDSPRSDNSDLSPPSSFNDFTNVFDFDFSTSSNEIPSAWQSNLLSSTSSPKSSASASCSPSPSFSSLDGSDSKSSVSRESSPSHEDRQRQRRRFPCLILGCARRFTSQYTLKVHMEAHKPKPRSSFPCTHGCSERFSRQHDRLRHEVSKHGKVCEHSCDECGRFFSSKKTLGNHKCPVAQGNTRWVNSSVA